MDPTLIALSISTAAAILFARAWWNQRSINLRRLNALELQLLDILAKCTYYESLRREAAEKETAIAHAD